MFNCNWGFMHGFGSGWGMGGFGSIFNLLFIGVLIYLAYKFIQRPPRCSDGRQDRRDSLEILKRRYANGEISAEEFSKMRTVLKEE
ncbi:SHOCT domain-containing protein [Pseudodesulfovibrio methanolicus]|uniref:SHOCT domain-containing protein n=1 Tax=Pseudodesulfovibrio methanolicus TaxID=3126690 RepID=A0ABZ2J6H7_9BACT